MSLSKISGEWSEFFTANYNQVHLLQPGEKGKIEENHLGEKP